MMTRQKLLERPYSGKFVVSLPLLACPHLLSTQCLGDFSTNRGPLLASLPGVCKVLNEPILIVHLRPSSPILDVSTTHKPNPPPQCVILLVLIPKLLPLFSFRV